MKLPIYWLLNPPRMTCSIFQPSEQVTERLHNLLEKNRESVLTPDEKAELEETLRLGRLLNAAVLKARIRLAGKA